MKNNGLRAKRIAIVRYGMYPADAHVRRNVLVLREAGFDVDVICHHEPGLPLTESVDGATVLRLPIQHKRGTIMRYAFEYTAFPLLAALTLAVRSVRRRYDVVEIDTLPDWLILAGVIPKVLGAKLILYLFEDLEALLSSDFQLTRHHPVAHALLLVERLCAGMADHVVAVSDGIQSTLTRQGFPSNRISFVPNVPDEQVFLSRVPSGQLSRMDGKTSATLGEIDSPPPPESSSLRLVTHGSLLRRYGIQTLLEATSIARRDIPGLQLDIIGDGDYRPELETLAQDLDLNGSVTFSGNLPFEMIAPRLLEADVAVIPRWDDSLPLKLMEYLALGLPIITTRLPSVQARLDESTVLYVEPKNAANLAAAIVQLHGDPARRAALASAGRSVYQESFSWVRTKQQYLNVFNDQESGSMLTEHAPTDNGQRMRWLPFVLGQSRGLRNAASRLPTIVQRFGWTATKSERNLQILLDVTARYGACPTLAITAMTAQRNAKTVQRLLEQTAELAAHGYVHNDYASLTQPEQRLQIAQAREVLTGLGVDVRGWRCPYFRWNAHTLAALEASGFEYDSTSVYVWPVYEEEGINLSPVAKAAYERLCALFSAKDARTHVVLPTVVGGLVQIPASLPQDEDMVDRLHLDGDTMARVWRRVLHSTHDRGEVLVLNLHPERAALFAYPLTGVLEEARRLGDVWVATMGEIARWWRERDGARVSVDAVGADRWQVTVRGPDRLRTTCAGQEMIGSGTIIVRSACCPVIHCATTRLDIVRQRLRDAGYVYQDGDGPGGAYGLDLEDALMSDSEPDSVVRFVQAQDATLVHLEPWPDGYRSCLSITGDIDAITLVDFAMRLKEF